MSDEQRIEETASAIEDLLYMEAIRLEGEKASLSPKFELVAANVKESMKLQADDKSDVMKLMYYSLLIYMNEYLKMPKALTMAFGNDMENHRENMESGTLVTTYVAVLSEIWSQNKPQKT
ncbi:MAG: hypothetical protein QXJ74_08590 [Nitrososphaera sp.]